MLLRLLLALTIALLPMPAVAACHAPQAPTQMGAHHHGVKHEPVKQAPAEQLCMGCVAPATVPSPELAPPLAFARPGTPAEPLAGEPLTGLPPATPPPRSQV
ncbi:hypothetical protein OF829_16970 [Sphingomonas sp. LB-2]|uniref:hypothetical protein n=1 Tax=Sphingomonas caeni TaxID=2984949 RepID=UPI002230789B|nr:hypothetical protein [Sphingomonas caeni]MCW3848932.1 hypothetical protein [Sphingomonas caeni]